MLTYREHFVILSLVAREKIKNPKEMRKCRNWQTSKTKDLVSIALVWVQVPSSALEISMKCDMRKCRNWQTSKTKDLVSIALVWVQVPSSA